MSLPFGLEIEENYINLDIEYKRLGSWVGVWKEYRDSMDAINPDDVQNLLAGVMDEVVDKLDTM